MQIGNKRMVSYTMSVQVDITLFPNPFYITDLFGDIIVLCLKRGRYGGLGKRVKFLHGHSIKYIRETNSNSHLHISVLLRTNI